MIYRRQAMMMRALRVFFIDMPMQPAARLDSVLLIFAA